MTTNNKSTPAFTWVVESTGGNCAALVARLPHGLYLMVTETETQLAPREAGPYTIGLYHEMHSEPIEWADCDDYSTERRDATAARLLETVDGWVWPYPKQSHLAEVV